MTASFHCCGTFPSRQMRVVSWWNSSRMVRFCCSPSVSSSAGSPSGPTAFSFAIAFIAVAISSSMGSIPRALAIGCCGSLFGMSGSSMSDLEFSNERKNRTHLSRVRPLSRSSLPPSSRTHCDSTFFVSSSCTDLMFWKKIRCVETLSPLYYCCTFCGPVSPPPDLCMYKCKQLYIYIYILWYTVQYHLLYSKTYLVVITAVL